MFSQRIVKCKSKEFINLTPHQSYPPIIYLHIEKKNLFTYVKSKLKNQNYSNSIASHG